MRRLAADLAGRYLIAAIPEDTSLQPVFWVAGAAWNPDPMQGTLFRDEQVALQHVNSGRDRGSFGPDVSPFSLKRALSGVKA